MAFKSTVCLWFSGEGVCGLACRVCMLVSQQRVRVSFVQLGLSLQSINGPLQLGAIENNFNSQLKVILILFSV